jgi:hypothetical protein
MSSKITKEYGAPLPIDFLFHQIALRYSERERDELKQIYQEATWRYTRAAALNNFKRIIRYAKQFGRFGTPPEDVLNTPKFKRHQYCLDHPQEFINGDFTLRSLAAGNPLVYTKIRE